MTPPVLLGNGACQLRTDIPEVAATFLAFLLRLPGATAEAVIDRMATAAAASGTAFDPAAAARFLAACFGQPT